MHAHVLAINKQQLIEYNSRSICSSNEISTW